MLRTILAARSLSQASSHSRSRLRVVCVEGNIGSGKSTFLSCISRTAPRGRVTRSSEPVDRWRSVRGVDGQRVNLLQLLYEDPQRWAFTFNLHVLLQRLRTHQREAPSGVAVRLMERSAFSLFHCFVKQSVDAGDMSAEEGIVLEAHYRAAVDSELLAGGRRSPRADGSLPPLVDAFIYLRAAPAVCLERVQRRGRSEEAGLSLDFLQRLHERHEAAFGRPDGRTDEGTPVIVVENGADVSGSRQRWKEVLAEILDDCDSG